MVVSVKLSSMATSFSGSFSPIFFFRRKNHFFFLIRRTFPFLGTNTDFRGGKSPKKVRIFNSVDDDYVKIVLSVTNRLFGYLSS